MIAARARSVMRQRFGGDRCAWVSRRMGFCARNRRCASRSLGGARKSHGARVFWRRLRGGIGWAERDPHGAWGCVFRNRRRGTDPPAVAEALTVQGGFCIGGATASGWPGAILTAHGIVCPGIENPQANPRAVNRHASRHLGCRLQNAEGRSSIGNVAVGKFMPRTYRIVPSAPIARSPRLIGMPGRRTLPPCPTSW
jgi:hypothetical protein